MFSLTKTGGLLQSFLNKSNCFAAAFFDSFHAIWASVVAVAVP